ncbi:unnamed protein product [Phytophthora lilii]|uniref:Unnamed protein product n=1 Tax=Phytophthora lilii TaxID=2077276 RepID=A0A9W6TK86_9STRA|nr:unnamed protein product [Phytophthora lilii]
MKPEVDDGFAYIDGHKFDGKFHNIFVLDSSGSMSGQPWQDLLRIHCEAASLGDSVQMVIPYSGGVTCFEEGLRAASEILSRNKFEEFKAVLIFFSDGRPRDLKLGLTLARYMRSTYAKYDLKTFVVGFRHVNLPVLKRTAAEMGGEYRQVLDANALTAEFQHIAAVLRKNEASLALISSYNDRGEVSTLC